MMTVSEIAGEIKLTVKATERAVAKLLKKDLIQRAPFRQRSYTCDSKQILLGLLTVIMDLREKLKSKEL
jgi:DNA-binding MarR family transcriptional regulator